MMQEEEHLTYNIVRLKYGAPKDNHRKYQKPQNKPAHDEKHK